MEQKPTAQLIKIDPNGKYILAYSESIPVADAEKILESLNKWQKSGEQFLFLSGADIVLIRDDSDEKPEAE